MNTTITPDFLLAANDALKTRPGYAGEELVLNGDSLEFAGGNSHVWGDGNSIEGAWSLEAVIEFFDDAVAGFRKRNVGLERAWVAAQVDGKNYSVSVLHGIGNKVFRIDTSDGDFTELWGNDFKVLPGKQSPEVAQAIMAAYRVLGLSA